MKHRRTLIAAAILFIVGAVGLILTLSRKRQEPYLEIEFKRIQETWRLMETYAQEIWPGWDNYGEIQFGVQFPNLVHLIVNPIEPVPEGYVRLEDRTLGGKEIYLNRTDELPIRLEPPLTGGGGGGYRIRIQLRERPAAAAAPSESEEERGAHASEDQILLYVHEYFHGFQQKVLPWMQRPLPAKPKPGEKPQPTKPRPPRPKNWRPERYEVTLDYAVYKEIAGLALLRAYTQTDSAAARACLEDYVVARERQLAAMPKNFADDETRTQVAEGTATYSNTKMAMLVQQPGYEPSMSDKDDPYFFDYRYMDAYIQRNLEDSIKGCVKNTLDTLGHSYTYGVYQCLLLDRFLPGWKDGFFQNSRTMDAVMTEFLKLTDDGRAAVAERFEAKYGLAEIRARHGAVIRERDDAIATVEGRSGRKFIVDFEATKEFFNTKARGGQVVLGVRQIFLNGVEEITLGDVKMTSIDTPMERDWLWTVQWVDTAAPEGDKAYEMQAGRTEETPEGPVYKDVTIRTAGFTLTAPEVRLTEEEGRTLRIEILSKVARDS